ncbi:MAG: tryptophan--tRNA ligase [Elusimicrobiaceae bacterium]
MEHIKNDIVVSGMRPTGRLHLGNYFGALRNFVELQNKYKCYFFVADLHALTTAAENTGNLAFNSKQMVIDWLAAGLDPEKCSIFVQSHIPEISELTTLLGMITPLGWLLRNPTYKEQLNELFRKKYAGQEDKIAAEKMAMLTEAELSEMSSFGFLGYPVLMATDILIHKAAYVPVGQDQTAHMEIARDTARRFNDIYDTDILVEPKPLFTSIPKVPGLDGRKMSKSYGNTIELGEEPEAVRKKVMSMFTDPNKQKANDPANPDGCTVFAFHKIYNPDFEKRAQECRAGALGCVACKKHLFELMEKEITEFNQRRDFYAKDEALLKKILSRGAEAARESASKTLAEVKKVMKVL